MKASTIFTTLILAAAPSLAAAQGTLPPPVQQPPAPGEPLGTTAGSPNAVTTYSTAEFAQMAYAGSDFLESTSRVAFEKATDRRVRNFARAEVQEQVRLLNRLGDDVATGSIAAAPSAAPGAPTSRPGLGTTGSTLAGAGIGALVGGPIGALVGAGVGFTGGAVAGRMTTPEEKRATYEQLQTLPAGPEFDLAYVQLQIIGHQEAYALHSSYAQTGDDPELRRVAREAAPLIRRHLAQLQQLNDRLSPRVQQQ